MQLPTGAQTWISCGFDSAWTAGEHLTASVFDAVQVGNWQRAGDSRAKKPQPVRRPTEQRQAEGQLTRMEQRARVFRDRHPHLSRETTGRPRRRDARGRFTKEG